jgi:hemolysin activation/secretion protein
MSTRVRARAFAFFALAFCSALVLAQQAPPPGAGSILREQTKERPKDPPKPEPSLVPRSEPAKPALSAPPGLKVTPTAFKISGNTIYSEAELADAAKEFLGKEQDINGLNDAATKVRAYYRERGYFLAQAYLPRQQIRNGVVEIAVIEGRIGRLEVNIKEGTRISESLIRNILEAHLKEGDIITETGLEKPLLLVNDLPNAVVTSEIRPSKTVGAADLRINLEQADDLVNGFVDFDNGGSRFTGEYRLGITLNVNSPLGMGDQLTLRTFATEERFLLRRIAYVLPVGSWGTRIGVSLLDFDYRVGKDFSSLNSHGYGTAHSLFMFHPFIRTRNANLIAQYAYEDKKLFDRVDLPTLPENLRRTDTFILNHKLGVVGDFRDGLFGGGLNAYQLMVTEGDVNIAQPTILAADQAGRRTAGSYSKYNYEFRRLQRISDQSSLLLAMQGQIASKNLTSAERFSLGGPAGVRAYPIGEAVGDDGYLINVEYRYIMPGLKIRGGDLTLSGFYDVGHVRVDKDYVAGEQAFNGRNNRTLAGAGVGLSLGRDGDFLFRAVAAWRTENEEPTVDGVKRIPRVWFQAVRWF